MHSKIPRHAVKALQSDRSQPAFARPGVLRESYRDARGKLRGPHLLSRGKTIANPVRAFMTNMFELRTAANIGWRFAR
jgi:hypothetical protein